MTVTQKHKKMIHIYTVIANKHVREKQHPSDQSIQDKCCTSIILIVSPKKGFLSVQTFQTNSFRITNELVAAEISKRVKLRGMCQRRYQSLKVTVSSPLKQTRWAVPHANLGVRTGPLGIRRGVSSFLLLCDLL